MMAPSLDYFLVIARTQSLTKASEELYVTQQNLSAYLKRLETYYGLPLFHRHPRFELTEFGKYLYQEALHIQSIYQRIEVQSKNNTSTFDLRLGCRSAHPHDYIELLPFQDYKASHPHVNILFTEYHSSVAIQKERDGSLDFACSTWDVPCGKESPIQRVILRKNYCYVLISRTLIEQYFPDDPGERINRWQAGIALKELKGVPYFSLHRDKDFTHRSTDLAYYQKYELLDSKMGECYSRNAALNMCRHSMCFFVSGDPEPESDDFFSFPVTEPESLMTLYCYCNVQSLSNPNAQDFWDMVKNRDKT